MEIIIIHLATFTDNTENIYLIFINIVFNETYIIMYKSFNKNVKFLLY